MEESIKSEIRSIIDEIDHHLAEIDERIDRIYRLLDSIEEASQPHATTDDEVAPQSAGREEVAQSADSVNPGNCPLCGSLLRVLSQAPLMLECSNTRCPNRFPPK